MFTTNHRKNLNLWNQVTIRIFSKKHNLYTNSPFWPSNQRTTSEFVLGCKGEIIELLYAGKEDDNPCILLRDKKDFVVEPWTGYFDINGRKIYRGDILAATNDPSYESEVIWSEGSFVCRSTKNPNDQAILDMDVKVWKRVVVKGNIHGVEYSD
jgi:hypothetical protein